MKNTLNINYSSFLKLDAKNYQDRGIAIVNGDVIPAKKTFSDAYKETKRKFPKRMPLIAKMPSKKVMIYNRN